MDRLNLYRTFLKVQSYNCNQCTFSYYFLQSYQLFGTASGSLAINGVGLSYTWSTGDTTAALNQLVERHLFCHYFGWRL
jgi:hypothetical protein